MTSENPASELIDDDDDDESVRERARACESVRERGVSQRNGGDGATAADARPRRLEGGGGGGDWERSSPRCPVARPS